MKLLGAIIIASYLMATPASAFCWHGGYDQVWWDARSTEMSD